MSRCLAARRRLVAAVAVLPLLGWLLLRLARLPADRSERLTPRSAVSGPAGHSGSALAAVRTSGQLHSARLPPLVSSWLRDSRPDVQVGRGVDTWLFSQTTGLFELATAYDLP